MKNIILIALAFATLACSPRTTSGTTTTPDSTTPMGTTTGRDASTNGTANTTGTTTDPYITNGTTTGTAGNTTVDPSMSTGTTGTESYNGQTGSNSGMVDQDVNQMGDTGSQSDDVQATIDAVEANGGDITALPASAAVSNIDGWINTLQDMDGTSTIVDNLKSLKTELGAGSIDGAKVSQLLSSLAADTRKVGAGNTGLNTLASALDAGAAKLSGK